MSLAAAVLPDEPGDLTGPGLVIDETAYLREGSSAACVAPQHAGVTGKVENYVTWVFTACGQARADFDIYMPASLARAPERRRKAGIPAGLAFATKPELAIDQARRVAAPGIWVLWAAADEVYGRCPEFRGALRLLVARLPGRGKSQYTFYLRHAPAGRPATITYFIVIAGRRWPTESTFSTGKDAFGWDQCQARTSAA